MWQQADAAIETSQTFCPEIRNNKMSDGHLKAAQIRTDFHLKLQLGFDLPRKNLLQGKSSQSQPRFQAWLSKSFESDKTGIVACRQRLSGKSAGRKKTGFFFNFLQRFEF